MRINLRAVFALGALVALGACASVDAVTNARYGADALQVGDYGAAERYLTRALQTNPADEYALLNLGAVYQATDRPALARETYAKIIRKHDPDSTRRVVARRETGLEPLALAEARLIGLAAAEQAAAAMTESDDPHHGAALDDDGVAALHGSMDTVLERLHALDEAARMMSSSLRRASAATTAEQAAAPAAEEGTVSGAAEDAISVEAAAAPSMEPAAPPPSDEIRDAPLAIEAEDPPAALEAQTVSAEPDHDDTAPALQPAVAYTPEDLPAPLMSEGLPRDEPDRKTPMRLTSPTEGDDPAPAETGYDEQGFDEDKLEVIAAVDRSSEAETFGDSEVRVHLASYRNEETAERGWSVIRDQHRDLLQGLGVAVRRVDFGPDMGVYYRLHAGPLDDEAAARSLCDSLKSREQYCEISFF